MQTLASLLSNSGYGELWCNERKQEDRMLRWKNITIKLICFLPPPPLQYALVCCWKRSRKKTRVFIMFYHRNIATSVLLPFLRYASFSTVLPGSQTVKPQLFVEKPRKLQFFLEKPRKLIFPTAQSLSSPC